MGETEFYTDIESPGKMTHFEPYSADLNSKYLHFMEEIRCQKTMKYNLSTKLLFLQNDENALMTFLHSTDCILMSFRSLSKENADTFDNNNEKNPLDDL